MSVSRFHNLRKEYQALCRENKLTKIKSFLEANQANFPSLLAVSAFQAGMVELNKHQLSLASVVMNLIIKLAPDECIVTELPTDPLIFPSLMHTAAHYGNADAIRALVARKHIIHLPYTLVSENVEDVESIFPMHIAAGFNSYEILRELIKHGGNVNQQNTIGMTPLMFAVQFNNPLNVILLIDKGANVAIQDLNKQNILFYAAKVKIVDDVFLELLAAITNKNANCLYDIDTSGHTAIQAISMYRPAMLSQVVECLVRLKHIKTTLKTPISLNEFQLVCAMISAGFDIKVLQFVAAKMVNNFNTGGLAGEKLKRLMPSNLYAETAIPLIEIMLLPSDNIFIHPTIAAFLTYMRNAFYLLKEKKPSFSVINKLANLTVKLTDIKYDSPFDVEMYTQQNYIFEFAQFLLINYREYIGEIIVSHGNSDVGVKDQDVFFEDIKRIIDNMDNLGKAVGELVGYYCTVNNMGDFVTNLEKEIFITVGCLEKEKESTVKFIKNCDEFVSSLTEENKKESSIPKSKKNKSKKKQPVKPIQKAESSYSAPVSASTVEELSYPVVQLTAQMKEAFSLIPIEEAYIVGGAVFDALVKTGSISRDVDLVCVVENIEKTIQELISREKDAFYRPFPDKNLLQLQLENGLKIDLLVREKSHHWFELDQRDRDFRISMFYVNRLGELQPTPYLRDGLDDMKHYRLVMTGDPVQRFNEDPVRILRAVKLIIMKGVLPDDSLKQALLDWMPPAGLIDQHHEHINAIFKALINSDKADSFVQSLNEYCIIPRILGNDAPNTVEGLRERLNLSVATATPLVATTQTILSYLPAPILPATMLMNMVTYVPVVVPVMVLLGHEDQLAMYNQQMPAPSGYYAGSSTFFSPMQGNVTQMVNPYEFNTGSTQLAQQVIHRNCGQNGNGLLN